MAKTANSKQKHVPTSLHWKARFFSATAPIWKGLASVESAVLREEIERTQIDRPIYVAGVPRAGTTILTELLSEHPRVTSHRYSDFPNVYTPFWRNWLADRSQRRPAEASERAHKDRILVSTESPEAVEEVIWSQFFEDLHGKDRDHALGPETRNEAFERFYRDHVRKLLLVRGRQRYLAKGNYNTTRLPYLRSLFPDARIIVPIRNPINQVASLVKQDRLFQKAHVEDPRVARQLELSGHYEFGPGRRPIILGDIDDTRRIAELWDAGRDVAGWALYWASVYDHVLKQIQRDPELFESVHVLRYEDFCREPEHSIRRVLEHAELDADEADAMIKEYAGRISLPDYYRPDFSAQELEELIAIAQPTATAFGYGDLWEPLS